MKASSLRLRPSSSPLPELSLSSWTDSSELLVFQPSSPSFAQASGELPSSPSPAQASSHLLRQLGLCMASRLRSRSRLPLLRTQQAPRLPLRLPRLRISPRLRSPGLLPGHRRRRKGGPVGPDSGAAGVPGGALAAGPKARGGDPGDPPSEFYEEHLGQGAEGGAAAEHRLQTGQRPGGRQQARHLGLGQADTQACTPIFDRGGSRPLPSSAMAFVPSSFGHACVLYAWPCIQPQAEILSSLSLSLPLCHKPKPGTKPPFLSPSPRHQAPSELPSSSPPFLFPFPLSSSLPQTQAGHQAPMSLSLFPTPGFPKSPTSASRRRSFTN